MKKRVLMILAAVTAVTLMAGPALAGGFRIPEAGAKAMGLGNAFVGQADDPSAVQFNPAGIIQVPGNQIQAGFTHITVTSTYKDEGGDSSDMDDTVAAPPQFYYTNHLGEGPWWIGLGMTSPFGLASSWDVDSFRFILTKTSLEMAKINPVVAYKVNDKLSFGGGMDYYQVLEAIFEQNTPVPFDTGTDTIPDVLIKGNQKLQADGTALGFNVGALYTASDKVSVGFCYRTGVDVDLDGDVKVTVAGAGTVASGGGKTVLKIPPTAALGVAWKPAPGWGINFDLDWTGWSAYDELALETDLGDRTLPKDYEDTTAYRVGASYQLNAEWVLRGGLLLDSTPVPAETYDGRLPDGDRIGYSLGAGYRTGPWTLDFAAMFVQVDEFTVDEDVVIPPAYFSQYGQPPYSLPYTGSEPGQTVDGSYEGSITLVGLSVGYAF